MVKLKNLRMPGIWFAVIVLYLVPTLIRPSVFNWNHFFNVLQVASFLGVVALGQTLVILTGGFDLSVSGVITATTILLCMFMAGGQGNTVVAFSICIAFGIVTGLVNGLLISKVKIAPMICTLGTESIIYGLALLYTGGMPKGSTTKAFAQFGQSRLFHLIPSSFVVFVIITAIMVFISKKTKLGRQIYAVGVNVRASRAAGVNVDLVLIATYVLSSLMAVCSGILIASYINLPSFSVGDPYQLNSIATVVISGTLLTGGVGSIIWTVGGALFLTQLNSITNILNIGSGGQLFMQGVIIAFGVIFSNWFQSKDRTRRGLFNFSKKAKIGNAEPENDKTFIKK